MKQSAYKESCYIRNSIKYKKQIYASLVMRKTFHFLITKSEIWNEKWEKEDAKIFCQDKHLVGKTAVDKCKISLKIHHPWKTCFRRVSKEIKAAKWKKNWSYNSFSHNQHLFFYFWSLFLGQGKKLREYFLCWRFVKCVPVSVGSVIELLSDVMI